jgi:hypothetical protein
MPIGFVAPALQGASLISRFGIPLLQQAGIGAGVAGLGALANAASKTPSNAPSANRRANVGSNRYSGIVGSIPPSANGESYRRAELRLADAARTGGGGGGGGNAGYATSFSIPQASTGTNPASERAYQQEVSRVAQLTAQDPELQRYEQARQKAVAAGPGSAAEQAAEDLGMQIWAQKYGKLASKVKPGQAGYDVIQRTLNAGQMGTPADLGAFTDTAPTKFLGNSGAPVTSSYTGVIPTNLGIGAIGPNALTNAYNMQTASTFNKFMEGPTLSSQPLGAPTASIGEVPTYSQLSQPQSYNLGPMPGEEETFGSDASQKFANTYAKKLLNFQPI